MTTHTHKSLDTHKRCYDSANRKEPVWNGLLIFSALRCNMRTDDIGVYI